MYPKCIPHLEKLLCTFCIQNLSAIVFLILYTKFMQKPVKMWNTFCIHLVYISWINLVQFLYTKCMQNSYEENILGFSLILFQFQLFPLLSVH